MTLTLQRCTRVEENFKNQTQHSLLLKKETQLLSTANQISKTEFHYRNL